MSYRGYSLLMLLPMLIIVALSAPMITLSNTDTSVNQAAVLSDARQQLLVYAATYLKSYPPTGAGPGHLPCPDTDHSADVYEVQWGLRGDGPNPPCGKNDIAIGKLPRHISHLNNRYAFHLQDKHAIGYAVDTRFINNPTNRVVNPSTDGRMQLMGRDSLAAVLFYAKEGSSILEDGAAISTLQRAFQRGSTKQALFQSVTSTVALSSSELLDVVILSVASWMEQRFDASGVVQSCALEARERLYLSLLDGAHTLECDGVDDLERVDRFVVDGRLEGVFLKRHWFYRNNWWQFVSTGIDSQCVEALDQCHVRVSLNADGNGIVLQVVES